MCRSSPGISLCQVVCGWYINQSVHNFVENNQLQFASSCFMRLPTEIVKHVRDAAGVSVSVCDKSCRSSLDQDILQKFWLTYHKESSHEI